MNGYKLKNGEVVIMLILDRYPVIIFGEMIKCGSSILMGAKMKILNIPQGIYLAHEKKMSKKSFHQKQDMQQMPTFKIQLNIME